ncbi:(Fe-S)-binding protein [Allonocardiopsis opalescens]|uniref:Glycolate oxidase iron-sulfur subunit n=1 Tax=Allonocardiopsis opalescens TaxID=1144618 RepID=A0A2T0QFF3_9ACTN|nr:heterodisulfide reductase-related iron-sulfur binding cluster [Allonocardiopsis opalescens]PRY02667.1 glycolate oxidase iron-sulfur subunit [Allonocardiopsis opalescens]
MTEFSSPERLLGLADDCVHCGFCLPSCPTYLLWGEEMDSPRGRIHLIRQGLEAGGMPEAATEHVDACLGCLACVTACPSGVRYGPLIEAARADVEEAAPRGAGDRLLRRFVFSLFPYPERLRLLRGPLRAYQASGLPAVVRRLGWLDRFAPPLAALERIAPPLRSAPRLPERVPARGPRRAVVGMLTGCVQSAFFPQVNAATARVLALEGADVIIPRGQGCCGALSAHSGRREEARRFARRLIARFERAGVDAIVVNSAGCGSAMKEYAELLHDDPTWAERARRLAGRVRDLSEFLVELGPVAPRHELAATVAYHDACHLSHGQGVRAQPRALLAGVPGLRLAEIEEPAVCCGSAGVYNVLQPRAAADLGERKARNVAATGAQLLVAANPGCTLQIASALRRQGTTMAVAHVVEVLDASLRGRSVRSLIAERPLPSATGTESP